MNYKTQGKQTKAVVSRHEGTAGSFYSEKTKSNTISKPPEGKNELTIHKAGVLMVAKRPAINQGQIT
jgi:hypothetical protein